MKNFEEILKNNPGSVYAALYAEELSDMGNVDRAIEILRENIKINPYHAPARSVLAELLFKKNNDDDAAHELEIALKLDPQSPRDLYNMGKIFIDKKNTDKAESCLWASIVYEPDVPETRAALEKTKTIKENMADIGLSDESESVLTNLLGGFNSKDEDDISIMEPDIDSIPQHEPDESELLLKELLNNSDEDSGKFPDIETHEDEMITQSEFNEIESLDTAFLNENSEEEMVNDLPVTEENDMKAIVEIGSVVTEITEDISSSPPKSDTEEVFSDDDVFNMLQDIESDVISGDENVFADLVGDKELEESEVDNTDINKELFDNFEGAFSEDSELGIDRLNDTEQNAVSVSDNNESDIMRDTKLIEIDNAEEFLLSSYSEETPAVIPDEPVLSHEEREELLAIERGHFTRDIVDSKKSVPEDILIEDKLNESIEDNKDFSAYKKNSSEVSGSISSIIPDEFLKQLSDEELEVLKVSDYDNSSSDFDLENETKDGIDYIDILPEKTDFIEEIEHMEDVSDTVESIWEKNEGQNTIVEDEVLPPYDIGIKDEFIQEDLTEYNIESLTEENMTELEPTITEEISEIDNKESEGEGFAFVESIIKNAPDFQLPIIEENVKEDKNDSLGDMLRDYIDVLKEESIPQDKPDKSLSEPEEFDEIYDNDNPNENVIDVIGSEYGNKDDISDIDLNSENIAENEKETDITNVSSETDYDVSESSDQHEENATGTMAEIYAAQGLYSRAINIYNIMLSKNPGKIEIVNRIEELKKLLMKQNSQEEK